MLSYENLIVEKLTYQAQVMKNLEDWNHCYKYIEEAIKAKKEDVSNFQLILFEDSVLKILSEKLSNYEYTKQLGQKERKNKGSLLVYVLDELKNSEIREIFELCEKILKMIENVFLKKKDLMDYHKSYLDKMRGDLYLIQDIIAKDSEKTNKQNSSINKDYSTLSLSFYKSCYQDYFENEKCFCLKGCQLSLRVGITYSWVLSKIIKDKNKSVELLSKLNDLNKDDLTLDINEYSQYFDNKSLIDLITKDLLNN
jgi:hypothetical protein